MHSVFRSMALIAATLLAASPCWSWTRSGHEVVGAIAAQQLTGTHAAREVRRILGHHETLQTAAIWADCVKSVAEQPPYAFKKDTRYPECDVFATRKGERAMKDYVRRNLDACQPGAGEESCHRQYHYVNLAMQREGYATGETGASDHDVVAAMRASILVLRGRRAPAPFDLRNKREALRLLTHLVGDLHQPLHVGSVYLDTTGAVLDPDPHGAPPASLTRGGNAVRIDNQNLHGLWDAIPPSLQLPAFPASLTAQDFASVPRSAGQLEDWPLQWVAESLRYSREAFAPVHFGPESDADTTDRRWSATLPADYALTRERIQRQRLIDGGVRLAQLLKAIWP